MRQLNHLQLDLIDKGNMPEFNFYVLAYFDLLGQTELLDEMTDEFVLSCISEGRKDELIEKIKPTISRVKQTFRDHLRLEVAKINQPIEFPEELKGKVTEEYWKAITTSQVDVEFMGDAALLKVCITDKPDGAIPTVSIKDLILGLSMQMLAFLSAGVPVRGSIELGWGTHIEENSIYGTMLHRAVRLEKQAGYPRIIIGQNFLNYINPLATHLQADVASDVASIMMQAAQDIISAITEDHDGHFVLNYLQRERYSAQPQVFDETVNSAKGFIESEIIKRDKSGERGLHGRYVQLREFFRNNDAW